MTSPLDIRPPATPIPGIPQLGGDIQKKAQQVAKEFEAMVLGQLLQPMFESLDSDGLFGGGSAEKMFRPMLVEQYASGLAKAGGIGLADGIAREIIRLQTQASVPTGSA